MNGNDELLNYIYQNSQMGLDTIKQLLDIVKDNDFAKHLQSQVSEYHSINDAAKEKLHKSGYEEKGIGAFAKISAYMTINMQTLADKSASHIAEMMIQGSTMGIIQATKNLKKYSGADQDILDLMSRLLTMEQNNVEQLKKFL